MSLKQFFSNAEERISAVTKAAEADARFEIARARIFALDQANAAKRELIQFYEEEVARVHAETAQIQASLDSILSKL